MQVFLSKYICNDFLCGQLLYSYLCYLCVYIKSQAMSPIIRNSILPTLILLLTICTSTLKAQQRWSLEACIDYAHKNNLQVKQQEIAVKQAQTNVKQSKLDFIPSFNASIGHNFNWGKSVNINDLEIITNKLTQSTSANVSTSTPIVAGLAKHYTLKSSRTQLQISQQEIEKLKNEISIAITQAYLQVLLAFEIEKSAEQSYKSVEQQKERTKVLVDAGSQPFSALLDMEAQLASELVQLIAARNDIKSNMLTLAQLMELPQESGFEIETPLLDDDMLEFAKENISTIYDHALSLPQIKSAELELQKSRYDYKMQKGQLYPSISFTAGYGTYFSDSQHSAFFDQFNENRNPSVGLSLTVPIFNGWRKSSALRNAGYNVENAKLELKRRHNNLYKEIQQANNNAENSFAKCRAALQNMRASQESFTYVENKFNAGVLNSTDYIVAKTNLFKAESEYFQSKFQYIFQLKILDFYKGIPIKL